MKYNHHVEGNLLRVPTRNGDILMDAADQPLLKGSRIRVGAKECVYIQSKTTLKCLRLSRVIIKPIGDEIVIYRNGNPFDCRKENLVKQPRYGVTSHKDGSLLRLTTKEGKVVSMDAEDEAVLDGFHLRVNNIGYVELISEALQRTFKLARLIMCTPIGESCDHINGDPLDNRKANLRNCTHRENCWNRRASRSGNNIYKGVYYRADFKGPKKWVAQIAVNGKMHALGTHLSASDAARVYNEKAVELCGQFARLNVIGHPKETVSVLNSECRR